VFAREGVLALMTRRGCRCRRACGACRPASSAGEQVAANRPRRALTRLGPTYVKLGQFLATRPT